MVLKPPRRGRRAAPNAAQHPHPPPASLLISSRFFTWDKKGLPILSSSSFQKNQTYSPSIDQGHRVTITNPRQGSHLSLGQTVICRWAGTRGASQQAKPRCWALRAPLPCLHSRNFSPSRYSLPNSLPKVPLRSSHVTRTLTNAVQQSALQLAGR